MQKGNVIDCVVIGAGPAGLSFASALANMKHKCTVLEQSVSGGHLMTVTEITDYPGIEKIWGYQFISALHKKAESAGAEIKTGVKATSIEQNDNTFFIKTNTSDILQAKSVVMATGVRAITSGLSVESNFIGKGVSYCAECDGGFFTNKPVAVYGSGEGFEEAIDFLAKKCEIVYHVSPQKKEVDINSSSVKKFNEWKITNIEGSPQLSEITIENSVTKDTKKIHINGLFIYMGKELANELLKPFTTKDGEINTAGMFVTGHLNFPSATLVETCANGIKTARDVDNFLEKKEL